MVTLNFTLSNGCGTKSEEAFLLLAPGAGLPDDKICCIYIAPDKATVQKHVERGGFPANSTSEVRAVIDPTTAER